MTSIVLAVTGARAWATVDGPLTSGMVGIPVTMEFDASWDGLTKNLVCRCSKWGTDVGEYRAILNVGDTATVAHEVMQAGMYLHLGIEGYSPDGKLVIPTTWAMCGKIQSGANTGTDLSADPTLPVWEQLREEIGRIQGNPFTEEHMIEIRACVHSAAQSADTAVGAVGEAARAAQSAAISAGRAETAFKRAEEVAGNLQNAHAVVLSNPYSGKVANFLGDSITALNTVNASKPYHAWVAELLGVSVNNYGLNGSSFADNSSSAKTFCERYESMADADLVVVAGGVNDTLHSSTLGEMGDTTTATVYGALDVLCRGLRAKYPIADIVFLTPTEWVNSRDLSVEEVADAVVSVCNRYAIPVYDNRTFSGIYPTQSANRELYLSDTIHWNDTAHEKVGRELSSFLLRLKGYPSYHFVRAVQTEYSVTNKLTNVISSNPAAVISAGDSYTATLTAVDGYVLSGVSVTMNGADITAAVCANGIISIDSVTGNVVITASAIQESAETAYYTVTNNLTNAQTTNTAVSVVEGSAYSATITAVDGYALYSVTVTMGGVDVTADVYAGGMVSIGNVSGNVVITATASAIPNNLVYPYPALKDSYSLELPSTYCYVLLTPLPVGVIKTIELQMKRSGTLKCYLATHDAGSRTVTVTNHFSVDGTTSFTEHSLDIPVTSANTVLLISGALSRTNNETAESGGFEYNYFSLPENGVVVGSTYTFGRTSNGYDIAMALRLGIDAT